MGLLDEIEEFASKGPDKSGGEPGGAQGADVLHQALQGTRFGGVQGLLQHLEGAGLGDKVASWRNPQTPNAPTSPGELHGAIGGEVEKIAQHLGVPPQMASAFLAQYLPQAASQQAQGGQPKTH